MNEENYEMKQMLDSLHLQKISLEKKYKVTTNELQVRKTISENMIVKTI